MKEIDYDEFLDHFDNNMKTLKENGEVWLLTHKGRKDLVVMHKDTYERLLSLRL